MISYTGRNPATINFLKTLYFATPEWTPVVVSLMPATWMKYRADLEEIVLAHPRIFPGYQKGDRDFDFIPNPLYELGLHTDCWGVIWENIERGLDSFPLHHPLADWDAFDDYVPPDPWWDAQFGPRDWDQVARTYAAAKARGDLAEGGLLPHGFFYMLLFYLRGFENLMIDMATGDPRLWPLIRMVESYNCTVINKSLDLGADLVRFGDDLGLQAGLPISPAMWRRYIKPSYEYMFRPCRQADVPIYLHSDGHILEIIPDLIEVGVRMLNPQIRANGLPGLVELAKGKVAIHIDLDRQLFPFATPAQIEDHIGEVFAALYLPQGGLMIHAECEPDVSLENIDTICTVLEKVCRPLL
ncbi:MAG: hypothetical protein DYG89_53835 [Caldilinea sp. CFX5]|nr:hypothetical protein [Caldilinea sp. CFX5]